MTTTLNSTATTTPVRPDEDPQTHPATDPDAPDFAPRPGEADPSEPQPVVEPVT